MGVENELTSLLYDLRGHHHKMLFSYALKMPSYGQHDRNMALSAPPLDTKNEHFAKDLLHLLAFALFALRCQR